MSGPDLLATAEQVVATWNRRAQTHGFQQPGGVAKTDKLTEAKQPVAAYVSDGRWVGDCPRCTGGIAAWPEHDRGCCFDCGTVVTLEYPEPSEIAEADAALSLRPDGNRHWRPDRGETGASLRLENIQYGYAPS